MNRKWFFIPLGTGIVIALVSLFLMLLGVMGLPLVVAQFILPGAGGMDVQITSAAGGDFGLLPSTTTIGYDYDGDGIAEKYRMTDVQLGTIDPATNLTVYKFVPLPFELNGYKTMAVKITIGSANTNIFGILGGGTSVIICHDVYIASATVGDTVIADYVSPGNKAVSASTYDAQELHIFWMDKLASSNIAVTDMALGFYLCHDAVQPPLSLEPGPPLTYPEMWPGPYELP